MIFKLTARALSVCAVFLSFQILAQAPVVDRAVRDQASAAVDPTAVRNNYLEIQTLRREVSELRGLIEELEYELRKVQRRQDDDYQNLDQRITGGGSASIDGSPIDSAVAPNPTSSVNISASGSAGQPNANADQLYRDGFDALRNGDQSTAVSKFDELVTSYPGSAREADALYWLGESYWLDLETEKSRKSFTDLVNKYPEYRKSADAQYRLGLIYDQLGDKQKAVEFMQAVADGDSNQAEAAKSYLQDAGSL